MTTDINRMIDFAAGWRGSAAVVSLSPADAALIGCAEAEASGAIAAKELCRLVDAAAKASVKTEVEAEVEVKAETDSKRKK